MTQLLSTSQPVSMAATAQAPDPNQPDANPPAFVTVPGVTEIIVEDVANAAGSVVALSPGTLASGVLPFSVAYAGPGTAQIEGYAVNADGTTTPLGVAWEFVCSAPAPEDATQVVIGLVNDPNAAAAEATTPTPAS